MKAGKPESQRRVSKQENGSVWVIKDIKGRRSEILMARFEGEDNAREIRKSACEIQQPR